MPTSIPWVMQSTAGSPWRGDFASFPVDIFLTAHGLVGIYLKFTADFFCFNYLQDLD